MSFLKRMSSWLMYFRHLPLYSYHFQVASSPVCITDSNLLLARSGINLQGFSVEAHSLRIICRAQREGASFTVCENIRQVRTLLIMHDGQWRLKICNYSLVPTPPLLSGESLRMRLTCNHPQHLYPK